MDTGIRRIVAIAVLAGLLAACGGPSEANMQATVAAAVQETAQAAQVQAAVQATFVAAVPTPTPDAAAIAYQTGASADLGTITKALTEIDTLLASAENHSAQPWIDKMTTQAGAILSAYGDLAQLVPPANRKRLHTLVLASTADCKEGAGYLPGGVKGNRKYFDRARVLLKSCDTQILDPIEQLAALENG